VKPDGPDQPGTQMSIAELEVYAATNKATGRNRIGREPLGSLPS